MEERAVEIIPHNKAVNLDAVSLAALTTAVPVTAGVRQHTNLPIGLQGSEND